MAKNGVKAKETKPKKMDRASHQARAYRIMIFVLTIIILLSMILSLFAK